MSRALLALPLALLLAAPALAADDEVHVEASLQPAVIGMGETATLIFEARTSGLDNPRFRPDFVLENLQVTSAPHKSEDIRFVNGAISRSYRFTLRVRPLGTGKARVHSIVLFMPGETIDLGARQITVQEEPARRQEEPARPSGFEDPFERLFGGPLVPRRRPRGPAVFLRSEITPERPYVGQQALYTIHLYTRDDISSIMPRELPKFRGFWVRDIQLPQSSTPDMVDVGGTRYARVVLLQKALFPLRPGRHQIEPAEVDLVARVIEQRFFGPPLSHPEQVRLSTSPQFLTVQPLPPAPAGFSGIVGQVDLEAELQPAELRLGEAANLAVRISGRGNLQGVTEPLIDAPDGVTFYPPQQQDEDRTRGTTVAGRRVWSYVVVPDRTGRTTVQVPEISYFDPESRTYKVAAAPALEMRTLPRLPATGTGTPNPVRTAAMASGALAGWTGWTRWAPLLFALPWGLAFVVFLARRRRPVADPAAATANATNAASPPGLLRSTGDVLEQRLREAETDAHPRQAAARIEDAWRELLAARWDIPSATPAHRWGERLAARGADPSAAAELTRLAEDLHFLRYAPQLSETGGLVAEVVDRSRRLLRRLR